MKIVYDFENKITHGKSRFEVSVSGNEKRVNFNNVFSSTIQNDEILVMIRMLESLYEANKNESN